MPISDCEVQDPRIRRTRLALQQALRTLLESKSFDQISVQDIAEKASVNRATFYDHYTDKFALLEAFVAGGFHHLLQERNVRYDGTCPSAASAIVLATCDFLRLSHSDASVCERQHAFEPLVDAAVIAAIRRVLSEGVHRNPSEARMPELVAATASWAIYGASKQWFRTPNRPSADEIVPVVLQLILPILQDSTREAAAVEQVREP